MPKDELIYVGHMLDMSQKAVEALKGKTRPLYDKDELLRLALAHLIQTIGEAGSNVSESFRNKTPNIPWKKIIGMRHKVVHDYIFMWILTLFGTWLRWICQPLFLNSKKL